MKSKTAAAVTVALASALAREGTHPPVAPPDTEHRVPCVGAETLAGCRPAPHPPHSGEHERVPDVIAAPRAQGSGEAIYARGLVETDGWAIMA